MYEDIKWEFQFWPKIIILFELNILYYSTYVLSVFIWLPMAKMEMDSKLGQLSCWP